MVAGVQQAPNNGAEINDQGDNGIPPLLVAAKTGDRERVAQLFEKEGIDPNPKDDNGRTPLSWAAGRGNQEIVELLLEKDGIDPNSKDNNGRTPLSWAAGGRNSKVVKRLLCEDSIDLNSKDNNGRTPLSWASGMGNQKIVELLLEKDGIDLNSKDNSGRTPLSWAANKGTQVVVELLLKKDVIDPNLKDDNGRTPLLLAAGRGNWKIVELLLEKDGIDLNSKDNSGQTPLLLATENKDQKTIGLLLRKDGIDLNLKDDNGRSPLLLAAENKDQETVELLLGKDGIDPNLKDDNGRTPLLLATQNRDQRTVRLLLGKDGPDPNLKDNSGRTPLSWAAEKSHLELVRLLAQRDSSTLHKLVLERKESLVRLLLDAKYNVNTKDSLGKAPLHIAISSLNISIATRLILFNATNINLKDNDGITPLRLAAWVKSRDLIQLLLKNSDEWRRAYGKQESDIVMLSERGSREKSVCFIAQEDFLDKYARVKGGADRRLFLISNRTQQSELIPAPKIELAPYGLEISLERGDDGEGDTIFVGTQFPSEKGLENHEPSKTPDWDTCRITWTMVPPSNPNGDRYWTSLEHFSMMPFGWIPKDGVEFFGQFILYLKERWLKLCDLAEDHLTVRRLDQLNSEGKNPELIGYLANYAQSGDFPNLSKMALDILSIPAMATSSERLFSSARLTVTNRRNRLNIDTIETTEYIRSWNKLKEFDTVPWLL